jgi:hypothetical protein
LVDNRYGRAECGTRNLDEAIDNVSKVYCPHAITEFSRGLKKEGSS